MTIKIVPYRLRFQRAAADYQHTTRASNNASEAIAANTPWTWNSSLGSRRKTRCRDCIDIEAERSDRWTTCPELLEKTERRNAQRRMRGGVAGKKRCELTISVDRSASVLLRIYMRAEIWSDRWTSSNPVPVNSKKPPPVYQHKLRFCPRFPISARIKTKLWKRTQRSAPLKVHHWNRNGRLRLLPA